MSVEIILKGSKENKEHQYAKILRDMFEKELNGRHEVHGKILIQSSKQIIGQDVRDFDIIVIGKLQGYYKRLLSPAVLLEKDKDSNKWTGEKLESERREVEFQNFIFTIEVKSHPTSMIRIDNDYNITCLMSKRDKSGKQVYKPHDATNQSEKQKYALINSITAAGDNFFTNKSQMVRVSNFLWLTSVTWEQWENFLIQTNKTLQDKGALVEKTASNSLPGDLKDRGVKHLFQMACIQQAPVFVHNERGRPKFSAISNLDNDSFGRLFDWFSKEHTLDEAGGLTREKLELITKRFLRDQKYFKEIDKKLTIVSGMPGTGKTIKLLRIAYDLVKNHDSRCIILTYNKALRSDIQRMFHFTKLMDIDDKLQTETLHKFFKELFIGFELIKNEDYHPDKHDNLCLELFQYLDKEALVRKDIDKLMTSRYQQVHWDYVLIDEGQDCSSLERDIIYKIYDRKNVIVAEGPNQMVRSGLDHSVKCDWTERLKKGQTERLTKDQYNKTHERVGLRQKSNLVNFVNSFTKHSRIPWEIVDIKHDLPGGKVYILTEDYFSGDMHSKLVSELKSNRNDLYDMMFLANPRSDISEKMEKANIKYFNGLSGENRKSYPTETGEHRLFFHESCRGLEGWTVVCYNFDKFISYKKTQWTKEKETGQLALKTDEQKKNEWAYHWGTIALTRAIDTIVITLDDKNSEVSKILKKVYQENDSFVTWMGE